MHTVVCQTFSANLNSKYRFRCFSIYIYITFKRNKKVNLSKSARGRVVKYPAKRRSRSGSSWAFSILICYCLYGSADPSIKKVKKYLYFYSIVTSKNYLSMKTDVNIPTTSTVIS